MTIEHQFNMLVREIRKECVGNGPREITTRFAGPWAISEMKGNLTTLMCNASVAHWRRYVLHFGCTC
ncbi:DUF2294 family protein [Bacillus sp. NTK034]|nr:DUF2294 family protein [Bacillus sp. NTK034]